MRSFARGFTYYSVMPRYFLGGFYQPGKPLPMFVREEIVDLYNIRDFPRNTRVTKRAVHNVVQHFALHGTTQPFSCGGSQPILITNDILEVIEIWKLRKPSVYASEIRERLLREGICTPANVPPIRQIQTVTNKELRMTYKKLTSIPSEYMTPENLAKVDDYLNITSRLIKIETLHFFDEASVIVTSGNRMFGSGYRGQPAIEVQRYASNANASNANRYFRHCGYFRRVFV